MSPVGGSPSPGGVKKTVVIICPEAFENDIRPETYGSAADNIEEGTASLGDVVPRSATLLHEGFHVVFGVGGPWGMLEGPQETCKSIPWTNHYYCRDEWLLTLYPQMDWPSAFIWLE